VSVEPVHLFRYLDELTFRYNHRDGLNGTASKELSRSKAADLISK
jgi:hypothetical protein